MKQYDKLYFEFISQGSLKSAALLLPIVNGHFHPQSVADFGCGAGAWLKVWKNIGVREVIGVDGEYVMAYPLFIDRNEFRAADLSQPIDLGRTFDLVQCLEVAEHLPESAAGRLVETLVRHSEVVLFSAAVPGQGGYQHINEQPYEYWRRAFASHNYSMYDVVRPSLARSRGVDPWYAFNTFVFADDTVGTSLPLSITRWRLPDGLPIQDRSPSAFKLRRALLKRLPVRGVNALHKVKKHLFLAKQRLMFHGDRCR